MKTHYTMLNETTMTPEEYLKRQEQRDLDKLFDDAIKESRQRDLDRQAILEKERYFSKLVSKLCDKECEIEVCEQLISDYSRNPSKTVGEINDLKTVYKTLKMQYTKTKNELDRLCTSAN